MVCELFAMFLCVSFQLTQVTAPSFCKIQENRVKHWASDCVHINVNTRTKLIGKDKNLTGNGDNREGMGTGQMRIPQTGTLNAAGS